MGVASILGYPVLVCTWVTLIVATILLMEAVASSSVGVAALTFAFLFRDIQYLWLCSSPLNLVIAPSHPRVDLGGFAINIFQCTRLA
jgi:glycerol-3-phosphate acyltransferase PlsY